MYDAAPTRTKSPEPAHGRKMPNKVKEITVKRAANKGYIATHHFDNSGAGESYRSPEDHAFSSHDEMLDHLTKWAYGADTPSHRMVGGQKAAPSKMAGHRAAHMRGRGVD